MPITPFHFCVGAILKSAAPQRVSWTSFALTNCLIDIEPIAMFVATGEPSHQWVHTLPGILLAGALAATWGRPWCESWLKWWNRNLSIPQSRWAGCCANITIQSAWTGSLLGSSSHLAMDMFMHADVRPMWPLLGTNPMVGVISISLLHKGALLIGLIGLLWLFARRIRYLAEMAKR